MSPERRDEFGRLFLARGFVRRRLGLQWARLRHRRVSFGPRCDVRAGTRLRVAKGALARFGAGCVLDRGFDLECRGTIEVGDRTVFGHHCTVAAEQSITIGRDCLLAEMVSVRDHDHAFDDPDRAVLDQGRSTGPVSIGDNVWLGAKVTVTKGTTIGSDVVVGAHAVVTTDLPDRCVAAGIPARVVRQLDG
ncbi:MAG TPA: acyltransferase [Acidimicrobiales bacterium]|nr:acyltransferase [Acidimicrobiales bacterium]